MINENIFFQLVVFLVELEKADKLFILSQRLMNNGPRQPHFSLILGLQTKEGSHVK